MDVIAAFIVLGLIGVVIYVVRKNRKSASDGPGSKSDVGTTREK